MAKFPGHEEIVAFRFCKDYELIIVKARETGMFALYKKDTVGMHWLFTYKYVDEAIKHMERITQLEGGKDLESKRS